MDIIVLISRIEKILFSSIVAQFYGKSCVNVTLVENEQGLWYEDVGAETRIRLSSLKRRSGRKKEA
jgi:hypothetical protein